MQPCDVDIFWLVVSTHLKNISQIGSFPQVGVKIKIYLKPPPSFAARCIFCFSALRCRVDLMCYFFKCCWFYWVCWTVVVNDSVRFRWWSLTFPDVKTCCCVLALLAVMNQNISWYIEVSQENLPWTLPQRHPHRARRRVRYVAPPRWWDGNSWGRVMFHLKSKIPYFEKRLKWVFPKVGVGPPNHPF